MASNEEIVPCVQKRSDCFRYCKGKCLLLNSTITGEECPFYATKATVYDNRARSYERLLEQDMHDLIEKYGNDREYLNSFSAAQTGSYAHQVYRKYRYLKNSGPGIRERNMTAILQYLRMSENRR